MGKSRRPTAASRTNKASPTKSPTISSNPPTPQPSIRRAVRTVWRSEALSFVMNWVFRGLTVVSVAYLVIDRMYETSATITSPSSDPRDVLGFPFTITNSSHLFSIHNVIWTCLFDRVITETSTPLTDTMLANGAKDIIHPGQSVNISCNRVSEQQKTPDNLPMLSLGGLKILEAVVRISLSYDVDIFGYHL